MPSLSSAESGNKRSRNVQNGGCFPDSLLHLFLTLFFCFGINYLIFYRLGRYRKVESWQYPGRTHCQDIYVFITHDSPQLKKGGVYGFHGQVVRLIKRVPPPEYG